MDEIMETFYVIYKRYGPNGRFCHIQTKATIHSCSSYNYLTVNIRTLSMHFPLLALQMMYRNKQHPFLPAIVVLILEKTNHILVPGCSQEHVLMGGCVVLSWFGALCHYTYRVKHNAHRWFYLHGPKYCRNIQKWKLVCYHRRSTYYKMCVFGKGNFYIIHTTQ